MITVEELLKSIEEKNGYGLNKDQEEAVKHKDGPLWIIAGPGTGKTEVLALRCIKLICCDGVEPGSIIVTTFTKNAAQNLEDRIAEILLYLSNKYNHLNEIDISDIRIGTLHSICNDILLEARYEPYQNLRLLDDVENKMFIRSNLAQRVKDNQKYIQKEFKSFFRKKNPNLWDWTKFLGRAFQKLTEDMIDLDAMINKGGVWEELANYYINYLELQKNKYVCDFATLQKHFLDFLNTEQGKEFLMGNNNIGKPPIQYILVDEYQDTNPIQEEIYFSLAQNTSNLTVVGDDDQAIYRFRGATVDGMVMFGERCKERFNKEPRKVTLYKNYRSHKDIVKWINTYIQSFEIMKKPGVRVQDKPEIVSEINSLDNYPAVGTIIFDEIEETTEAFARTVKDLKENNIIEDYSQCVLLLRSTKDTARRAGKYIEALRKYDIPIYNPRSKSFLDQEEVKQFLGTFINIVDPDQEIANQIMSPDLKSRIEEWYQAYKEIAQCYEDLSDYVSQSINTIKNTPKDKVITEISQTILFRILSREPFKSYQRDYNKDLRLSKLTRLFEAFSSLHGRKLVTDKNNDGKVDKNWLSSFYYIFCGYLVTEGIDDDEYEDMIFPVGMFPIMTIHQSKGLEFDFVFVGDQGKGTSEGETHELEYKLRGFRKKPSLTNHTPEEMAYQDDIRLYYVAYSRAKHALILMGTESQFKKKYPNTVTFGEFGGKWIRANIKKL